MKNLIYILFFFFFSCFSIEKNIDHSLLNKRVTFSKSKAINKANLIIDNKIYVWDSWKPISYEKEIDWKMNPYEIGTWVLYFHSLRMVGVLARAYEFENDPKYLSKAMEIIDSWNKSYQSNSEEWEKNKFAWGDHTVTNRLLNISHLYFVASEDLNKKDKKLLTSLLIEQAKWLFEDENYVDGNNHSIMSNMALLQASVTLDHSFSKRWYSKANTRMSKVIASEITDEGVCIENSPGYHIFVMELLGQIIDFHKDFKIEIPKEYLTHYDRMAKHLAYIVKPDRKIPNLGDTYNSNYALVYDKFNNKYLDFVDSSTKQGMQPEQTDMVYPISGYGVFRQAWGDTLSFDKMTYLIFTNTNITKVHKQADNLSFNLYANKEDIFIDSGHWGYPKNDTINYLSTTLAHNTITIDNTSYDFRKVPLLTSANIYEYETEDDYAYLRASFKPDSLITFKRDIVYLKPNIIVLIDQVASENTFKDFQQLFNLSKTFKRIDQLENKFVLTYENSEVNIRHINSDVQLNSFTGDKGFRGLMAAKAMKTRKGTQIEFIKEVNAKEASLITIIEIENSFYKTPIDSAEIDIQQKESTIFLSYKDIDIQLENK